jgi:hypothetical protein
LEKSKLCFLHPLSREGSSITSQISRSPVSDSRWPQPSLPRRRRLRRRRWRLSLGACSSSVPALSAATFQSAPRARLVGSAPLSLLRPLLPSIAPLLFVGTGAASDANRACSLSIPASSDSLFGLDCMLSQAGLGDVHQCCQEEGARGAGHVRFRLQCNR